MDFKNALMLVAAVYGIVELAKAFIGAPWNKNPRVLVALVVVASFAGVFLVRASVWADTQVVGSKSLDKISDWSAVLVALMLSGVEAFAFGLITKGYTAISNIGQNQPTQQQEKLAA